MLYTFTKCLSFLPFPTNNWLFSVIAIAIGVAVFFIALLAIKRLFKKYRWVYSLIAGVFATLLVFHLHCKDISAAEAVLVSIKVFFVESDFSFIYDNTNRFQRWLWTFLYIVAPVLTLSAILSVLREFGQLIKLWFRRCFGYSDIYVFSELNEKSMTLAEDIYKNRKPEKEKKRKSDKKEKQNRKLNKKKRPKKHYVKIYFCDVFKDNTENYYELKERADAVRAICLRRDISSVNFRLYTNANKRCVNYFLIGTDENENINQAATMLESRYKLTLVNPDETTADKTAADETTADKTTADKTTADKTTADKTTADKTTADKTAADETTADETTADKTAAAKKAKKPAAKKRKYGNKALLKKDRDKRLFKDLEEDIKKAKEAVFNGEDNAESLCKTLEESFPLILNRRKYDNLKAAVEEFLWSLKKIIETPVSESDKSVQISLQEEAKKAFKKTEDRFAKLKEKRRKFFETNDNMYLFTTFDDAYTLIASPKDYINIRVRIKNEVEAFILHHAYNHSCQILQYDLQDNNKNNNDADKAATPDNDGSSAMEDNDGSSAAQGKEINALIVGLGKHGKEMIKLLVWLCQVEGYCVNITAFDSSVVSKYELKAECPALLRSDFNSYDSPLDTKYHLTLYCDKEYEASSSIFYDTLLGTYRHCPPDYVFVSLGDDKTNIATAANINRFFEQHKIDEDIQWQPKKNEPVIRCIDAIVYNSALNHSFESEGNANSNIHYVGSIEKTYSQAVIIQSELERLALGIHTDVYHCAEEEFWSSHYSYRSSLATVIFTKTRKERFRFTGKLSDKVKQEQIQTYLPFLSAENQQCYEEAKVLLKKKEKEEKEDKRKKNGKNEDKQDTFTLFTKLVEHKRWNAYMLTEGFVPAPDEKGKDINCGRYHKLLRNLTPAEVIEEGNPEEIYDRLN